MSNRTWEVALELDEAYDEVAGYSEGLGESIQQANSETALCGDAWAGAWVSIERQEEGLRQLNKRVTKLERLLFGGAQ